MTALWLQSLCWGRRGNHWQWLCWCFYEEEGELLQQKTDFNPLQGFSSLPWLCISRGQQRLEENIAMKILQQWPERGRKIFLLYIRVSNLRVLGGGREGCVAPWSLASRETPTRACQGLAPAPLMHFEGMQMYICPSGLCFVPGSHSHHWLTEGK